MPDRGRHLLPWRARATSLLVAVLAAGACATSSGAPGVGGAARAAARAWTSGACAADDRTSVSVLVDMSALEDGTDVTRCVRMRGATMTGIDVLRAAGFRVAGVRRFDTGTDVSFACRIDGRPRATEDLAVPGAEPYRETCADTPPTSAYWSYWTASRPGAAWTYGTLGANARIVAPGSVEGWKFSLGSTGSRPAPPDRVMAAPAEPRPEQDSAPASSPAPAPSPAPAATPAPAPTPAPATTPAPVDSPLDVASVLGAPTPTSPTSTTTTAAGSPDLAQAATTWLAGEVRADGTVPGPDGETDDPGLAIDVLLALRASSSDDDAAARIYDAAVRDADPSDDDPARLAKRLVATVVAGRPTGDVAGADLRADTTNAFAFPIPAEVGTFGRAYAVLGLARSGGAPRQLVAQLRDDQCPSGWFRVDVTAPCPTTGGDPDATSIAVQALVAARIADPASVPLTSITRAVDQLARAQHPDGSLGGGTGSAAPNANSTGLAAQAFDAGAAVTTGPRAARYRTACSRTGTWMATLVPAGDVPGLTGAIAYDATARDTATTDMSDGQRDQWRRATAQAVFAFAPVSLHRLGGTPLPEPTAADADSRSAAATSTTDETHASVMTPRTWATIAIAVLVGAMSGFVVLRHVRSTTTRGDRP